MRLIPPMVSVKKNYANTKTHLPPLWREIVNTTEEYIAAIEHDEDKGNLKEDAKMLLYLIEMNWERLLALEVEIDTKISDIEKDNVSKA